MVLADHVVWKHKDALEETRNANYSTAKFLKVRCSVIILVCPYLSESIQSKLKGIKTIKTIKTILLDGSISKFSIDL